MFLSASCAAVLKDVNGNGITGLTCVNAPTLSLTATGSSSGITVTDKDVVSNLKVSTNNGNVSVNWPTSQSLIFCSGTLNAAANGNIRLTTVSGNILLDGAAASGSVDLTSSGSILDLTNGAAADITAGGNSVLQAGGVIGLLSDPLTVAITNGSLGVLASGIVGNVSVDINGTVVPSDTLDVLNSPLGEVIFNGNVLYSPYSKSYPYLSGVPLSGIEQIGLNSSSGLTLQNYDEAISQNNPYLGVIPSAFITGVEGSLVNPCFSELSEPLTVKREGKKKKCDSF